MLLEVLEVLLEVLEVVLEVLEVVLGVHVLNIPCNQKFHILKTALYEARPKGLCRALKSAFKMKERFSIVEGSVQWKVLHSRRFCIAEFSV